MIVDDEHSGQTISCKHFASIKFIDDDCHFKFSGLNETIRNQWKFAIINLSVTKGRAYAKFNMKAPERLIMLSVIAYLSSKSISTLGARRRNTQAEGTAYVWPS